MREVQPWKVALDPVRSEVPALRQLSAAWQNELVHLGVYTPREMDALQNPGFECSWTATPAELAGPLTLLAQSNSDVVAGVELWQQLRDRYWFLEVLVRNQDPSYSGVGTEVVSNAIAWLAEVKSESGRKYGIRVHAMVRETRAVTFWTKYLGRGPDFDDAFIRTADFYFPAVGWIIARTPP